MKAMVQVAPAAAALFAASFLTRSCAIVAAAAPQSGMDGHRILGSGDTEEVYVYSCTVELHNACRPMFTEKEISRFDKSFEKCAEQIAEDRGLEPPKFDSIEVLGQKLDSRRRLLREGREERRWLKGKDPKRSTNQVKCRTQCENCGGETLSRDRRLDGHEVEAGHPDPFDNCMLYELTRDVDEDDHELAAFYGIDGVETTCSITISNSQTFDVLADSNETRADATCLCDTIIHGAGAPMLAEREMSHYDRCWIKEYNEFHCIDPTKPLMVACEVIEQQPKGGTYHRLLGGGNKVMTRKSTCRTCGKGDELVGDSGRKLKDINIKSLDERLCDCLMSGIDPDTGYPFPAFEGDLTCKIMCDEPVPTMEELEEEQALARVAFEEAEERADEKFKEKWNKEGEKIKAAQVEHKAKMDRHRFEQQAREYEFMQYQAYMAQVAAGQMKSSCAQLVEQSGCDDVKDMLPANPILVTDGSSLGINFKIVQGISMDPITGECDKDDDREVEHYIRFPTKKKDDEPEPEYDCEHDSKKCGDSKKFKSKYCLWDWDNAFMALDVELAYRVADMTGSEDDRMRRLGNDDEDFFDARDRARNGKDYCYLHYKVDCNCQEIEVPKF